MMWVVLDFGTNTNGDYAVVDADSIEDAAGIGAGILIEEDLDSGDDAGSGYCETVYVVPADREAAASGDPGWYRFVRRLYEQAPLQCCGGAPTADGHSGYCPLRKGGRTGGEIEEPT